jgi:hypothetical protein
MDILNHIGRKLSNGSINALAICEDCFGPEADDEEWVE